MTKIKKPIIILGQPRSGSSLLTAILNWHSQVSTSCRMVEEFDNIKDFLKQLLDKDFHQKYTAEVEQPKAWDELIIKGKQIGWTYEAWQGKVVLPDTVRHLAKVPQMSYHLKRVLRVFPDAKILFITRKRHETVASFGRVGSNSNYAFDKIGYVEGINRLAALWEGLEVFIRENSRVFSIPIVSYDSLLDHTAPVLKNILKHFELPFEDYINDVKLFDGRNVWRERIPKEYWPLLFEGIEPEEKLAK